MNTLSLNDSCLTQCTLRLVSQFSLNLLLGQEIHDAAKRWPSDKVNETSLKVHCMMWLSLSYKVFRWHPMNNRL